MCEPRWCWRRSRPRGASGFTHWAQTNLFATIPDTILTVFGLLLTAVIVVPLVRWGLIHAVWSGTDRTFCATAAQGGIQPDGWSGACWAFVSAKFQQFMVGSYPVDQRWRVILTAILFVALLVPLMIPKVPYKSLNAIVFFGVFPIVGFMLLIGVALPFGLVGLIALIANWVIWLIGAVVGLIVVIPGVVLSGIGKIGLLVGLPDGFGDLFAAAASIFTNASYYAALPFDSVSGYVAAFRAGTESQLGGQAPSLWIDLALSALAVLGLMLWMRRSARAIATTLVAMLLLAVGIRLTGLDVGLPLVETALWGGLLVTLVLSFVGISVSLPLGIVLALGRRSKMPVVKMVSVVFIETVRGVPLVTVLFMASVMLPLFLPPGVSFDKFLRALIGVALFASAYMAEVIRGGLQAIPKGQYEGADSLGLGYWQKMGLIVLPQAMKLVIPGIVNTFIGMFKDTSLVGIIGMFDLLGIVRQGFSDSQWASPQTPMTGLVFAGFVFWLFCFGMSRYSIYMERRLDTGHKR